MAIGAEEYCESVFIRHLSFGTVVDVVKSGVGVSSADVADTRLCAEDGRLQCEASKLLISASSLGVIVSMPRPFASEMMPSRKMVISSEL